MLNVRFITYSITMLIERMTQVKDLANLGGKGRYTLLTWVERGATQCLHG